MSDVNVTEPTPAEETTAGTETVDNTAATEPQSTEATPLSEQELFSQFMSKASDDIKGKPYLEGVDSPEKLFKLLDGAQTLLGKKTRPAADATEEEWSTYLDSIRVKSADELGISVDEKAPDAQFKKDMVDVFMNASLAPKQAQMINEGFAKAIEAFGKEAQELEKKNNAVFEETLTKIFGANRDNALKEADGIIDKFAPDDIKQALMSLDGQAKAGVAAVIYNLSHKYMREDDLAVMRGDTTKSTSPETYDSVYAKIVALKQTPEFKNALNPLHGETQEKIRLLTEKLSKMEQK